jgi:hypothetical protein
MSLFSRLKKILLWMVPPHFLLVLLAGQALVFFFLQSRQVTPEQLILSGVALRNGELWRLFTFLVFPMSLQPLWFALGIYITWMMGSALEDAWGSPRFFLFILTGWLATVVVCWFFPYIPGTNIYINGAFTLAFARFYPDMEFRVFFVVPVKVKYLAMFVWAGYILGLLVYPLAAKALLFAGILPHFLFFGKDMLLDARNRFRKQRFQKASRSGELSVLHICTVCGTNNVRDPDLQFRYRNGVCICEHCLQKEKT